MNKIKVKIKYYPDGYNFISNTQKIGYEPKNSYNWYYIYGFIDEYIANTNVIMAIVVFKNNISAYNLEQLEIVSEEEYQEALKSNNK